MHSLDTLVKEASDLAEASYKTIPILSAGEEEVARTMQICNACRYCEGFCAVFPAMTRRLAFDRADIHYLSNLCHNCGACLHACQYAPPHAFAVNVPGAMARVRQATYIEYAWPAAFGQLYKRNGLTIALAIAFSCAAFLAIFLMRLRGLHGSGQEGLSSGLPSASFYALFPHNLLAGTFACVLLYSLTALGIGVRRFWRNEPPGAMTTSAVQEAFRNVMELTYLGGGHGEGCNNADDRFSLARRRFHHLTFYGFLLCFAATVVATLYHYILQYEAPYPLLSVPVILGTLGGIGLLLGPTGLLYLHLKRHPLQSDLTQRPMDLGFIALLLLISISGLALLAWRATAGMGWLLSIHLGFVMALFLTMPYGKFAHGFYRSAALLRWAIEKRQPTKLKLGDD